MFFNFSQVHNSSKNFHIMLKGFFTVTVHLQNKRFVQASSLWGTKNSSSAPLKPFTLTYKTATTLHFQ